jgi:hypothetical protein
MSSIIESSLDLNLIVFAFVVISDSLITLDNYQVLIFTVSTILVDPEAFQALFLSRMCLMTLISHAFMEIINYLNFDLFKFILKEFLSS